ncbi:VOC family protein [Nocardia sp. NPDC051570]|uniref:VOC family protein n=1 Tax=Nocardia sp. NPDC051570 TaxID=3364324 RepID=UPI00378F5A64
MSENTHEAQIEGVQALALHHVAIVVSDVDCAVDFYCGVLGLGRRTDRPDDLGPGAWLDLGDRQIHLMQATVPPALGQHFAVLVDRLDTVVDTLRARGLEVSDPFSTAPGHLQSMVSDPDGNVVELHQLV